LARAAAKSRVGTTAERTNPTFTQIDPAVLPAHSRRISGLGHAAPPAKKLLLEHCAAFWRRERPQCGL